MNPQKLNKMKNVISLVLLVILIFSSCTSEEIIEEGANEALLKSYTLTRDNQGRYSIDYEFSNGDSKDIITDAITNTNEVHLFSGDVIIGQVLSEPLALEDSFLESYNITNDGSDSYMLDFQVKEGVSTFYNYNEETGVYEIHLNEGDTKGTDFFKTYLKGSEVLKIDFMSNRDTSLELSARSSRGGGPRSVSVTGEDDD